MTMRILNVNDMLDLKTGGGTAERTFQMSRFLSRQGASCEVLTIDNGGAATQVPQITIFSVLNQGDIDIFRGQSRRH